MLTRVTHDRQNTQRRAVKWNRRKGDEEVFSWFPWQEIHFLRELKQMEGVGCAWSKQRTSKVSFSAFSGAVVPSFITSCSRPAKLQLQAAAAARRLPFWRECSHLLEGRRCAPGRSFFAPGPHPIQQRWQKPLLIFSVSAFCHNHHIHRTCPLRILNLFDLPSKI